MTAARWSSRAVWWLTTSPNFDDCEAPTDQPNPGRQVALSYRCQFYLLFLIFFGFDFRCIVVQFFRHFFAGRDIGVAPLARYQGHPSRPGPF